MYTVNKPNPNKIDRRKDYSIVIDTETCPLDRETKEVRPENMWVYDCGFAVVNKRTGEVFETWSFVNRDIFCKETELMQSSYYAEKIPKYWDDIASGKRILTSFYEIRMTLKNVCERYNVKKIFAHNMRFDYGTLNNTQRWLTKSKYRYFFPYGLEICDTLKMARDVICKMPSYRRFCEKNGYLTKTNQLRVTAEILYRFITKDNNFIESHTGLEDVMIEKEICHYCYRQHKSMRTGLWEK